MIVVAGGGHDLLKVSGEEERDAAGHLRLQDIGTYLHERLKDYLESRRLESTIKYIDPSYIIRSCSANAIAAEYCLALGHPAVHAAMSGRTNMESSFWKDAMVSGLSDERIWVTDDGFRDEIVENQLTVMKGDSIVSQETFIGLTQRPPRSPKSGAC